jgi:hypothetical protein
LPAFSSRSRRAESVSAAGKCAPKFQRPSLEARRAGTLGRRTASVHAAALLWWQRTPTLQCTCEVVRGPTVVVALGLVRFLSREFRGTATTRIVCSCTWLWLESRSNKLIKE